MPNIANPRNQAYSRDEIERAIVAAGDAGDMEAVRELGKMLPPESDGTAPLSQMSRRGTPEQQYDARVQRAARRMDDAVGERGAHGLMNEGAILGLGDELTGVVSAGMKALTGDFNFSENYRFARDVDRARTEGARERSGTLGTVAEVAGGIAAVPAKAVQGAMAGRAAIAPAMREGAAVGALGGFGYGEGLEGSTKNAALGGAIGGAAGAALAGAGNALANRAARRATEAAPRIATQQAADDLGIQAIPAMTGGTAARKVTGGLRQGFISDIPIDRAVTRLQGQAAGARDTAQAAAGRAVPDADAGELVRKAANVYSKRTGEIGSKLYERAARRAGDARVRLPETAKAIQRHMDEIAEAPNGDKSSLYRELETLKGAIEGGDFSPKGVRAMRTQLREQIQERGLRGSNSDRVLGNIAGVAEDELLVALASQGKGDAANALRTASDFWRKRVETIDEVLEPVLGKTAPKSGEQIVSALESLASPNSGNTARLRRLMKSMPREEAASVRATVINRLGRPTKGAAEVIDESGFDLGRFLTQWNGMSPRARSIMFPEESITTLNKLADVAAGYKRAGAAMNSSNTAGAITVQGAVSGLPFMLLEPFTAFSLTAGQYAAGRLLASPAFARMLARPGRRTVQQQAADLAALARAEPAIANEIGAFQKFVVANDNAASVGNAAAEDEPN